VHTGTKWTATHSFKTTMPTGHTARTLEAELQHFATSQERSQIEACIANADRLF